ncbi:MAG: tRNA (adenosine(37)-N6)-dimethylallyltransferase MiaA [Pseudomonadota bacterium]
MTRAPILLAGPTASGKSALALALARHSDGIVVNADALQVYDGWRVLTARPSVEHIALAPHALYGTVPMHAPWSAGHWLRALAPVLAGPHRPIIVGGTGLYFLALTEGLAEIPPVPPGVRARADALRRAGGAGALADALAQRDPQTLAGLDRQNPMRLQRAWEVLETTGRGLAAWQADTPPPLLRKAVRLVLRPDPAWLNARIATRFDAMLEAGALEEVRANLDLDATLPSMQALGARELASVLSGDSDLPTARVAAITATRQYAKRQRSWFRGRMAGWVGLDPAEDFSAADLLNLPTG